MQGLLKITERGIYCQRAGVFIDPWNSVPKALITHAHSDHARVGCQQYLCTTLTAPLLYHRLGQHQNISTLEYGQSIDINGVKFSFHPAGHVVGSAQIRVEYHGEVWVVSGDYKTARDNISGDFELLRCHTFITESTFGLPVYQWPAQEQVLQQINTWWSQNAIQGRLSVISAYSLGKAQRIIQGVDHSIGPVYCHQSVEETNVVIRNAGVPLKPTRLLEETTSAEAIKGALLIAPGASLNSQWIRRFGDISTAAASGWMILRGRKRWQNVDQGFVFSDHADWSALNTTIKETGCEQVIVTHGYTDVFAQWLREQGYAAYAEKTFYEGESPENLPPKP